MQDKLRKFGQQLWQFKERLVLLIMLGVLGYQIFVVLNPEELKPIVVRGPIPVDQVAQDRKPGPPPLPVSPDLPAAYADIHRRNPFWMHAKGGTTSSRGKLTQDDLDITIESFQEVGDSVRVRLRTTTATKWYSENDKFEQFELREIDPIDEKVVIYAERYRQSVEVYKNR